MKISKLFWGLFFLAAAALVVISQVTSFATIGPFSIIATIFLVAVIIHSIAEHEFFGIFVSAAFLYMIFFKPLGFHAISPWILLTSAILVSIGLNILFHNHHRHYYTSHCDNNHCQRINENIDDNNPSAKVSFSSSSKYLHADNLQGGYFSASFGDLEVYFDQVQLSPGGANITLDCNFGSIKLYVPRYWQVIDHLDTTLGGVTNKNRFNQPQVNAPQLILSGNVHLGGVEINYI